MLRDQNIYQLDAESGEFGDSHIIKQESLLHTESYYDFQLKCNQQALDFQETLLM